MDVEIKELGAQKAMVVRRSIRKEQLGEAFMDALPKIGAYVGAAAIGAPFGRYPSFTDDRVDVEIGMPVVEHLEPSGDIEPGEIPSGRHAVTVHVGPYEGLPQTYEALFTWVAANGHQVHGAPHESYVDDPMSTPPDQLRTEVYIPIA